MKIKTGAFLRVGEEQVGLKILFFFFFFWFISLLHPIGLRGPSAVVITLALAPMPADAQKCVCEQMNHEDSFPPSQSQMIFALRIQD